MRLFVGPLFSIYLLAELNPQVSRAWLARVRRLARGDHVISLYGHKSPESISGELTNAGLDWTELNWTGPFEQKLDHCLAQTNKKEK